MPNSKYGTPGNDNLLGQDPVNFGPFSINDGEDYIAGYDGNDTLSGKNGRDTLYGGNGDDVLDGGGDDDFLDGEAGDDWLDGWTGNDVLYGGSGRDTLLGYDGNDYLNGGYGSDYLNGEAGNDTLVGGVSDFAKDTLRGGAGADRFRFYSAAGGVDYIQDFNYNEGDKIEVSQVGYNVYSTNNFSYDNNTGNLYLSGELFLNLQPYVGFVPSLDIILIQ